MRKKSIIIISVIVSIFILSNIVLTPKNYLKYVFYNLEKGNYDIVSYINDKDKNNIINIYKFCEKNNLSKPLNLIRKEDNDNYYVISHLILYGDDKDDYGKVIGVYRIYLDIKVIDKLLSFPKIKKVDIEYQKEDMIDWLTNVIS